MTALAAAASATASYCALDSRESESGGIRSLRRETSRPLRAPGGRRCHRGV